MIRALINLNMVLGANANVRESLELNVGADKGEGHRARTYGVGHCGKGRVWMTRA